MLLLNEHLVPEPEPDAGSIILDLDLFRLVDMPVEDVVLWEAFEQLRHRKNQVFEACITERTRRMIM